ncbi:hypothetical protein A3Q56_02000 [Intoshia linei]|uniref:YLP motif-containing protein 1 n=1 Tax=Intoshia linei TaxID=1819745 RepID=A0A177B7F2_9BILA|nr:hypothetical protein A3Q56_02000 [Intoshia linei]
MYNAQLPIIPTLLNCDKIEDEICPDNLDVLPLKNFAKLDFKFSDEKLRCDWNNFVKNVEAYECKYKQYLSLKYEMRYIKNEKNIQNLKSQLNVEKISLSAKKFRIEQQIKPNQNVMSNTPRYDNVGPTPLLNPLVPMPPQNYYSNPHPYYTSFHPRPMQYLPMRMHQRTEHTHDREFCSNNNILPVQPTLEIPVQEIITFDITKFSKIIQDLKHDENNVKNYFPMVVIVRGLPASGKSSISKIIKTSLNELNVSVRILSIDDYFTDVDDDTDEPVYQFDLSMEASFLENLFKSFVKQIGEKFFQCIVVDSVFSKYQQFINYFKTATSNSWEVYIIEMKKPMDQCMRAKRSGQSNDNINNICKSWEIFPNYIKRIEWDLIQHKNENIHQVIPTEQTLETNEDPIDSEPKTKKSKWDKSVDINCLDGIKIKSKRKNPLEEYLYSDLDYFEKPEKSDGKKRVKWADIEERRKQQRQQEIGFVVGVNMANTNDDSLAKKALNKTKYIYD